LRARLENREARDDGFYFVNTFELEAGLRVDFVNVAEPIRLNYSGSSALVITIQAILTQSTSNGTIHWSVGSPPDSTTVT
jgi:hypothetical protein